jgi:hypothetical protein
MLRARDYKAVLSVSVPPEQRERFYTSLAQIRQHAPFATKSALVVEAVIEAAEQERHLLEVLAHLPQPVQIIQDGLGYTWQCAGGQGAAATLLQAVQEALTAVLGPLAAVQEYQAISVGETRAGQASTEGGPSLDKTTFPDHQS